MATFPNIGSLDQKILIEQYTLSKNAYGEQEKTWVGIAEPWAKVEYRGGTKEEEDGKITSIEDIVFTIRHISTLSPKMRIAFDGLYYTIRSIENIGRKAFTEIKSDSRINEPADYMTADMDTITVDSTSVTADRITL